MRIIGISFILLTATAAAHTVRQNRDVAEISLPNYDYLPPSTRLALPAIAAPAAAAAELVVTTEIPTEIPTLATLNEIPASVRGPNGYEYRTVRRLKYRQRIRRDVSHLKQQQPHQLYLPPTPPTATTTPTASIAQTPKSDYLPPQEVVENFDDSEVVEAPALKISNEYLPPVDDDDEAATVTEPVELPTETEANELEPTDVPQAPEEAVESAVLAADGYHYRQPENPMEIIAQPKSAEYLPPLEKGIVEAEGPEHESAILADDGYHYRVVKRLRF